MTIEVVKIFDGEVVHSSKVDSKFYEIEHPRVGEGVLRKDSENCLLTLESLRQEHLGSLTEFYDLNEYDFVDHTVWFIKGKDMFTKERCLIGIPMHKSIDGKERYSYRVYVMNSEGKTVQVFKH